MDCGKADGLVVSCSLSSSLNDSKILKKVTRGKWIWGLWGIARGNSGDDRAKEIGGAI